MKIMKSFWILQYRIEKKIFKDVYINRDHGAIKKINPKLKVEDIPLIHWFNIFVVGFAGSFGIVLKYPFGSVCDSLGRCSLWVGSEIFLFMIFISIIYLFVIISYCDKPLLKI